MQSVRNELKNGFSLLEVTITVAITGLLVVFGSYALQFGINVDLRGRSLLSMAQLQSDLQTLYAIEGRCQASFTQNGALANGQTMMFSAGVPPGAPAGGPQLPADPFIVELTLWATPTPPAPVDPQMFPTPAVIPARQPVKYPGIIGVSRVSFQSINQIRAGQQGQFMVFGTLQVTAQRQSQGLVTNFFGFVPMVLLTERVAGNWRIVSCRTGSTESAGMITPPDCALGQYLGYDFPTLGDPASGPMQWKCIDIP